MRERREREFFLPRKKMFLRGNAQKNGNHLFVSESEMESMSGHFETLTKKRFETKNYFREK